jgi:hypothetical protein
MWMWKLWNRLLLRLVAKRVRRQVLNRLLLRLVAKRARRQVWVSI